MKCCRMAKFSKLSFPIQLTSDGYRLGQDTGNLPMVFASVSGTMCVWVFFFGFGLGIRLQLMISFMVQ